jgi:PadR family transcriptional regulator, regulatory protein AphA
LSSERPLTPTSYIVLGLVEATGRATPYEIKQGVAASVGNLWSVPHSQVYAEPARLASGGYLVEEREAEGRRRRSYELTGKGREALARWRSEPTAALPELRDPALLKVFFGADPAAVARAQLPAHEAKLREYEALRAALGDDPGGRGPALTLEAGIAHERVWIEYWRGLAGP